MPDNHPYFRKKTPDELLEELAQSHRGQLKLYIGAAPGVGKTYKMLQDAQEAKREGRDVVIGLIETHRRPETVAQLGDLETIPLRIHSYRGKEFGELDVEAIKTRRPEVVLVDELAHSNVPGAVNSKRYMDVEELLRGGIHVWSAMNIQHLESVKDIVQAISQIAVRERVPDHFIQQACEIQLIDVTPETLQKRMREGKIYAQTKVEQSLQNFFTLPNLSALRELALRELADEVDTKIEKTSGRLFDGPSGVHEKILVCIQDSASAEALIRRGYRMANRLKAELYILHVMDKKQTLDSFEHQILPQWQGLAKQFDAHFLLEERNNRKVQQVIIDVAKQLFITQILLGQSARTRWQEIWTGSIVNVIMRKTVNIDIHIVADKKSIRKL